MTQLHSQGYIRICAICQKQGIHNRMINQEQEFFCTKEEKYAWIAWIDTQHNPNMSLEIRLHHYCFSTKSRGSDHNLNLTIMVRIINFLRGLTTIERALEESDDDIYTQDAVEDFEETILQYLKFQDQEQHYELTKKQIELFREKAKRKGITDITINETNNIALGRIPLKEIMYCDGGCESIFSENNQKYFEFDNKAYCEYCYFTEIRQFIKCTKCKNE